MSVVVLVFKQKGVSLVQRAKGDRIKTSKTLVEYSIYSSDMLGQAYHH